MGEDQGQERAQLADDAEKSPEQLRAEIEDVREDLGDTAAALAAKTDVKARAREKADELKRTATGKKDEMLAKVRRSGSDETGGPAGAPTTSGPPGAPTTSAVTRARTKAQENPVPTAALGALVGGFLLGRLTKRSE